METLPFFKYNPDPIKLGVIKQEVTICPSCGKHRDFVYVGPFYSVEGVEGICPWCIVDGSAANKFNGEFQDVASCETVNQEEFLEELIHRTPGYIAWQQEYWLSHCGDFCAIIDYVGWKEIQDLEFELRDDIERFCDFRQMSKETFKQNLSKDGDFTGYLFRCIHCNKHRLYADYL